MRVSSSLLIVGVLLLHAASSQEVEEDSSSSTTDKVQQRLKEEEKRLWGSPNNNPEQKGEGVNSSDAASNATFNEGGSSKIPFVSKSGSQQNIHYEPPEGFSITSRVYTDPNDKLAHFDNDSSSIVFPYWECGVAGSTTVPIPLQHATVRHLLGGSQPNSYSGEEFGPHPQLVIALTSMEVVLNSGQKQTFAPGDIVLLEDVLSGGHKLKGHDNHDMTVMILTLTQHYHQVGRDKSSLKTIFAKTMTVNPCPTGLDMIYPNADASLGAKLGQALRKLQPHSIRRYFLTVVGLSISTLLGDFMGKVAPLWLAVVFGGGCFVVGGTFAFVKAGSLALDELEMRQERRQLRLQGSEEEDVEQDMPPLEGMHSKVEKP
jgi:hypothetical protein